MYLSHHHVGHFAVSIKREFNDKKSSPTCWI